MNRYSALRLNKRAWKYLFKIEIKAKHDDIPREHALIEYIFSHYNLYKPDSIAVDIKKALEQAIEYEKNNKKENSNE